MSVLHSRAVVYSPQVLNPTLEMIGSKWIAAAALLLAALVFFILIHQKGVFTSKNSRPNLVFITVDTLRADHTPFGSYERATMPHTAQFFEDGINFTQATTVRSRTVPAYASLLTGLYPYHTGVRELFHQLNESFETLPEVLNQQGYVTAGFVSSFVMIGKLNHLNQGFQLYDDLVGERRSTVENYERRSDETVNQVLKWLKQCPREKPFFLFIHLIDPHGPYDPPEEYVKFHSTQADEILRNKIPNYQFRPGILDKHEYIDRYDGEINFLDQNLMRLYEAFADFKDNTWFLFTADHGETLDEHEAYFAHGKYCYESETRIPLVWLPPDHLRTLYPSQEIRDPVSLIDIYPTSMQALGLSMKEKIDGESLLPRMKGEKLKTPFRFSEKVERKASHTFTVRDDKMKLIFNEDQEIATELYDLTNDPAEQRNLAGQRSIPPALQDALEEYIRESRSYRLPFQITTFPKELWKSGKDRTRFVEEHSGGQDQFLAKARRFVSNWDKV